MDLKKLTKDELIKMVEDRKHLVTVVNDKEKEIKKLKEQHIKELDDVRKASKAREESIAENQNSYVQKLKDYVGKQNEAVNQLVFQYGALLKTLQGTIDSHIYINDKIIEELKEE